VIVVTGGAGFVGSAYVRHLAATTSDPIRVLDALTYAGSLARLGDLVDGGRVELVVGDVADDEVVHAALAGAEVVVHAAAESHVDRSLLDPEPFRRTNVEGTRAVARAAIEHGVDRFVHLSTDEVYGPLLDDAAPEEAPLRPTSPYARSKAEADEVVLDHVARHGLPAVIVRSSNQYGPWQFPEKLIPYFTALLLDGRDAPLYGDGLHERDWLHVDDNVAAIELVRLEGEVGGTYNVSAHQHRSNRSVAEAIAALVGADRERIIAVADRTEHDRRYAMRTERIERLGFRPHRTFDPGLADTVRWIADHETWWRPLLATVRNR
jgi:dTDP-glucose 4,6-dehydratase